MAPRELKLHESTTLGQTRELVMAGREEDEGVICPCCDQQATVYARKVTSTMARGLLLLYRYALETNDAWLNVPAHFRNLNVGVLGQGGDWAKLAYWGLIEKRVGTREDGSNRTGDARITMRGRRFCTRALSIPEHAFVYNGEVIRFSGNLINIEATLGKHFSYAELFQGIAPTAQDLQGGDGVVY